jgi:hypothetical protein
VLAEQVLDDLLAPCRRDVGVDQRFAQLVGALEREREAEQLLLDVAQGPFGPGDGEEGIGIGERAVICHGVLLRLL